MSKVKLTTNHGDITIHLDAQSAPATAENFLRYVKEGHYNGTIFHRVIKGFMIQGGGFEPGMGRKGTREPIQNEAGNGRKNTRYSVAMARTMDPHSATDQFFINTADNDFLNHSGKNTQGWGYTAFGHIIEGQDVVDAIEAAPTGSKAGHQDVPKNDVVIECAAIIE
ncbi:peptidyl-prolyl cis-trans isomerase B (cyclophilin B) [Actinocorallia herbida]|uniref:Peptidyl-prolyl cis-trans isomerase n=1 Tax=Actinocorallia herbida TaxID=58109 RepID=A0A3N1CYV0_9ACTN|nr:peptidylprolyl isomerase [Actinocorallia herbida]ROO86435.1 peptidyl-prolyl cis-trans isomerase B (cyclophilin B) [Actinocorallia herbida]